MSELVKQDCPVRHVGNLEITAQNAEQFALLEEVTGYLDIHADASLPVLATVGGFLGIRAQAQVPVLATVGGFLYILADAQLPSLRIAHGVEGRLVAVKEWGLWYSKEFKFYAGCKGPLTKLKALALSHTYVDQDVAKYFAAAINAIDDQKQVAD